MSSIFALCYVHFCQWFLHVPHDYPIVYISITSRTWQMVCWGTCIRFQGCITHRVLCTLGTLYTFLATYETHGTCTMLEPVVLLNRWIVRTSLLTCTVEPGAILSRGLESGPNLTNESQPLFPAWAHWPIRDFKIVANKRMADNKQTKYLPLSLEPKIPCDSWLKTRNTSTLTLNYFIHQFACYTKLIVHIRTMFWVYF